MVIKSLNGIIGKELNVLCYVFLEKVVLEEGDRLKGEDDDSDDEEDEIEDSNWIIQMLKPSNVFSTRRGKAAETFNFFRGLEFKRENGNWIYHIVWYYKPLHQDLKTCM